MGSSKLSRDLSDERVVQETFAVGGMTCLSCVRHVENALGITPGVSSARVDFGRSVAAIEFDPRVASVDVLQQTVAGVGYSLTPINEAIGTDQANLSETEIVFSARPYLIGLLAAMGLIAFYLGIITLAQGWAHALQQLGEDRLFVGAIALGFGAQVGLFIRLRQIHARASAGGMAASTGTSTTAMLACCAHHLTEILPVLGLSGAAVFLNAYKAELLWVGILMNLAGASYLLWKIQRAKRMACQIPQSLVTHAVINGKT